MTKKHEAVDELDEYLADASRDPAFVAAYEDVDDRTRLLRELLGRRKGQRLSQHDVARAMGTTQSAVSELEGGGNDPRLSTLQRYARAVGARLAFQILDAAVTVPDVVPSASWPTGFDAPDLLSGLGNFTAPSPGTPYTSPSAQGKPAKDNYALAA